MFVVGTSSQLGSASGLGLFEELRRFGYTQDAHRPLGQQHDLASILSHVEQRVIGADYTIRHERQLFSNKTGAHPSGIEREAHPDGAAAGRDCGCQRTGRSTGDHAV